MEILEEAALFENAKMSHMSTSERVIASREAKRLVLEINKIYQETQETTLMDLMKRLTIKKQRIDIRLKGRPNS
ncbi:hypothetical protein RCH18_001375 [Flavobacterium sp. PL11]|jgi:hypothetical protein|uniref:hypothetical protein n=1 Tax=Flavobacterium sp. PL11 TaxID=3071717 RepID=UPI002DFF8D88|nr:hypothetical protein [Flavobacterium sp. PL11]